jgi:membrane carboxypeptidase/penicillin-binding protein
VAWVGYDDNRATGLTGAAGALPVWVDTLASLKSSSFQPVAPETVEDVWIDFNNGLQTTPACSSDAVVVSVPRGTMLPIKPDCKLSPSDKTPPSGTLADKIRAWFKSLVH